MSGITDERNIDRLAYAVCRSVDVSVAQCMDAAKTALRLELNAILSSPGKDGGQEVEPVAWLSQCIDAPNLFELAEPKETATNPKHWTDAFPVYRRPQPSPQSTVDAEVDDERLAKSLAEMVTEWVDGGIKGDTDWRTGLYSVILARIRRLKAKSPSSDRAASEGDQ